jgi:hypothetical protein
MLPTQKQLFWLPAIVHSSHVLFCPEIQVLKDQEMKRRELVKHELVLPEIKADCSLAKKYTNSFSNTLSVKQGTSNKSETETSKKLLSTENISVNVNAGQNGDQSKVTSAEDSGENGDRGQGFRLPKLHQHDVVFSGESSAESTPRQLGYSSRLSALSSEDSEVCDIITHYPGNYVKWKRRFEHVRVVSKCSV